ncbi:hypothetical protein TDB9533_02667 [Thalassocella blandensis]|nr:hypothetical protein TDB9533_02667 [Thalassocella blandensis]
MSRSTIFFLFILPVFAHAQSSLFYDGNNTVTFQITLPSGQAYVELFSKQNSVQNLAVSIQHTELPIGNGLSTYTFSSDFYNAGDIIEYRFYYYLPSAPGQFSPGPNPAAWKQKVLTTTNYFKTEDGDYVIGQQDDVFTSIYRQSGLTTARPQQTGWALDRAHPEDLQSEIEASYNFATFKGIYVKPCNSNVWINIQNTPYAYYPTYVTEYQDQSSYLYDIYYTWPPAYGTQPSDTFACGGEYVTIDTYIGPQQVRTNALVEFAYVIEYSQQ